VRPAAPIRLCLLSLLAAALAWGALPVPGAGAASGLKFLGCLSGKLPPVKQPRVARPGGCRLTQRAQLDGEGSGMNHLFGLTASPDGRSLYALSSREDSVLRFSASPLGLRQCFSGISELGHRGTKACSLFPHSGTEDATTGFNGVRFATVSPDGRSLYTVSADNAIGIFSRRPNTGNLTYIGCLTGGKGPNTASEDGACKTTPTATRAYDGIDSGLGGIASVAVSPDSRFVYVAATADAAITTLVRGADGSLSFRDCISGGVSGFVVGLTSPCVMLPLSGDNPHHSGLRGVSQIVISRDGSSLYSSSPKTSSVAEFRRDPATGSLSYSGCISGEYGRGTGPGDPCTPIPTAVDVGFDSGMWLIKQLAISRDGHSLYGLSRGDDSIVSFTRDPASGALAYAGCITANSELAEEIGNPNPCTTVPSAQPEGDKTGLDDPIALALSPSGRSLVVASASDSALNRFARNDASGALTYKGCLAAGTKVSLPAGPCTLVTGKGGAHQLGFAGLSSLAFAGGKLFATASGQSAVSSFSLAGG
jgi:6-phosphogluconolactonase (cycloisomerase 2 family)